MSWETETTSQMMKRLCYFSWHNFVTIMTRVYFGQLRNCVWILDMYKRFLLSPENPDWLYGFLSLIFSGYLVHFLWGKPAWCEVDLLHPSSVEVKNSWSCIPTVPCVVLNAWMQFTFTSLLSPISNFIKDRTINAIHFSCINRLVNSP